MNIAEQFGFDWQKAEEMRPLMEQWGANERAQAEQFTTESYAMHWSGHAPKELWESLPRYERARIVRMYEAEQDDLAWEIERWEPLYELFQPDGTSRVMPPRPFRIRDFSRVDIKVCQSEIDTFNARAQALADRLSADWSAGRPASEHTYDPFLADEVSRILGRKVVSIYPPPEVADGVPVLWKIFTVLNQERDTDKNQPINQSGPVVSLPRRGRDQLRSLSHEPAANITDDVLH